MIPKIKICGLTLEKEIEYVNECEADYAGFVLFYPKSKRNLSVYEAGLLLDKLNQNIVSVAVTVSPTLKQVKEIEKCHFQILQVHGVLEEEVMNYSKLPIIRAVNVSKVDEMIQEDHEKIIGYLFDGQDAGSGHVFDWNQLQNINTYHKWMGLAGGLNGNNIQEAIKKVYPDLVDVSSGVEDHSGKKSYYKIKEFVGKVRKHE